MEQSYPDPADASCLGFAEKNNTAASRFSTTRKYRIMSSTPGKIAIWIYHTTCDVFRNAKCSSQ